MSDESEELPGGHTYYNEGACYKEILINIENGKDIESCVTEYKYDDDFITVTQIDPIECKEVGIKNARNKRFILLTFARS